MDASTVHTGTHLWLLLSRAHRSVEAHALRHIESLDMGASDFAILEALLHKGPLPVQEIGAKVLLASGSMTAAVDRLEKRGLVERCMDEQDRRSRVVHLTEAGRELIERAFADHQRAMERAVSGLNAGERHALAELLRKLGRSAQANSQL